MRKQKNISATNIRVLRRFSKDLQKHLLKKRLFRKQLTRCVLQNKYPVNMEQVSGKASLVECISEIAACSTLSALLCSRAANLLA